MKTLISVTKESLLFLIGLFAFAGIIISIILMLKIKTLIGFIGLTFCLFICIIILFFAFDKSSDISAKRYIDQLRK